MNQEEKQMISYIQSSLTESNVQSWFFYLSTNIQHSLIKYMLKHQFFLLPDSRTELFCSELGQGGGSVNFTDSSLGFKCDSELYESQKLWFYLVSVMIIWS